MPRFIGVHPVAFREGQLQPLAKEQLPEGVTWNSTYSAEAESKTYCLWEAPTKEAVEAIFDFYQARGFVPTEQENENLLYL